MITEVFAWLVLIVASIATYFLIRFCIAARSTASKLLIVASNDFFENAEKMMKTAHDLPPSVLMSLETMMKSMHNGHGTRVVYNILRQMNREVSPRGGENVTLRIEAKDMRPELKAIFSKVIASWLNYVMYRSFLYQFLIHIELNRMAVRQNRLQIDEDETGMSILPRIDASAC